MHSALLSDRSSAPGPDTRFCQPDRAGTAVTADRFHQGQRLGPGNRYEITRVESGGVVLRSAVDREDAVTDEAESYVDFWTLRKFEEAGLGPDAMRIPGPQNERKREVARAVGVPTAFLANSSRHAAVYEAILNGAAPAAGHRAVLVIDEMNRADLAKVMGELMTLLESDKRRGAAEERSIRLTYSGDELTVPATLSVIGTINTADRSLAQMDLALRRRFEFILVPPEPDRVPEAWCGLRLRDWFRDLNLRLAHLSGRENLVGHADYMEGKLEEVRAREAYANDDDGRLRALAHVIRTKTVPFLLDLFRSDWPRARLAVGRGLFEETPVPTDLFDDDAETLEQETMTRMAPFWNPDEASWDGGRLTAALPKYRVAAEPPAAAPPPAGADGEPPEG